MPTADPVGAIGAYWASEHDATGAEIDTLTTLADTASLALANVTLYDELKAALARERETREAAEASTIAKDQFLAMVSARTAATTPGKHCGIQVIALRASRDHGAHARSVVERQARHMVRILDDLLDSSRIVRGAIDVNREMVDLCDVVREVVEIATAGNGHRRHIDLVLPSEPVLLMPTAHACDKSFRTCCRMR